MPAIGIGLTDDSHDDYKHFLLLISKIDTIHDWWNADRVKDTDDPTKEAAEKTAVIKFLSELNINFNTIATLVNNVSGLPPHKVIMSDIENSFTKYCSTKYDMSTIRDITSNDYNTLDLTDGLAQVTGFSDKTDKYGCKSTRVIWSDSGILNTPEQYKDIGKLIFKYFGVNEVGKLHLIIDSQAGRLTGASNSMVYDNDVATSGRTEIYNRMRVNINALNIADSASTRVGAGNIFHNYFPFTNKPAGEAVDYENYYKTNNIGNYKLNNWSLTDNAMYNFKTPYFIYAYYTNARPAAVPAGVNLWAELPFHNDNDNDNDATGCYHISLKVCITTVKGDLSRLVNGTEWESSFIQGNDKIKTKQGAGINTLSNLIGQIDKGNPIQSVSPSVKEFDLSPILNNFKMWLSTISGNQPMIKNILVAFIFDYKRSGDHEQVLSCKVMNNQNTSNITYVLSTGDQLCALWARCQGVSCIWHHGNKMDMYSFAKDVWSKIRQTRFDTVTAVLAKYEIIKTALSAMAVPNIKEIIEMHKIGTPLYSKYMELKSVTIYNKYLDDLLESIPDPENTLVSHYTGLIAECIKIIDEIKSDKVVFKDDDVNKNDLADKVKLDNLKSLLDNNWKVPQDKYSSFIGGIIACPARTGDEWKGTITPEYRKDMFGFTLEHHMKLFEKYYTLKQIHTEYNQKIFDSWHYGRPRDFSLPESNPLRKPNARPNPDENTIITDNAWELYYRSTKANYDKLTKEFLVSDDKKSKSNTTGSALFDEIFGGTDEKIANTGIVNDICEMNSSFDPSFVNVAKPTWLVRTNCHNTGGLYYGISKISEWLGDIIAPKTLGLGKFENNMENNNPRANHGDPLIKLVHPENLEPRIFYDKYNLYVLPPSEWLIVDPGIPVSTSVIEGSNMIGGGPDDTLTYVSAPKFIDYIETIMSNIVSDLDLNWVEDQVDKDDFKKYIIQTVKKLYLKYNQSDFNILYVYRLLVKLCELNTDRKNVANIYRYIFLLYDKIYPEAVEHTPFNPLPFRSDEDFQKKWDSWNEGEMTKLKTEKTKNEEELMKYIPDNKAVFFEFIIDKTREADDKRPELKLNRDTFRSVSVNTVNRLNVTITQLTHKGKDYLNFLKEKLYTKNGSCLLPDAKPMEHDTDTPRTSSDQQRPGRRSGITPQRMSRRDNPMKRPLTSTSEKNFGNDQVGPDNKPVSNSSYSRDPTGLRNPKKPRTGLYSTSEKNSINDQVVPGILELNSSYSSNLSGSHHTQKPRTGFNRISERNSQHDPFVPNSELNPRYSVSAHMKGGKRKTYRKEKIHHSRKRRINNTRKMGNQRRINRKHTRRMNRKHTRRTNRKHTRRINRKHTRNHRNRR